MQKRGVLQLLAGAVLFGLIPLFTTIGAEVGIITLLSGRSLFSLFFLGSVLVVKKENPFLPKKDRFKVFFWSMLLTSAMVCYFISLELIDMSVSGSLLGVQPAFIALLAILFLKEKVKIKTWVSCLICLVGIAFISGLQDVGNNNNVLGIVLALGAALFLAFNFIYHKKNLTKFDSLLLVFYQSIYQMIVFIPLLFFREFNMTLNGIIASAGLGILCTGLAYVLLYNGSKKVNAQYVGIFQTIENIIPVFLGVFLFNESPDLSVYLGISLIVMSCILVVVKAPKVKIN